MDKINYLNCDEDIDHLTIYKADEKIDTNIDIGLVILSLNKKKEIVGLEFMGVNKNFRIPLEFLNNLRGCKVDVRYNPSRKFLVVNVLLKYLEKESPITVSSSLDLGKNVLNEVFACVHS